MRFKEEKARRMRQKVCKRCNELYTTSGKYSTICPKCYFPYGAKKKVYGEKNKKIEKEIKKKNYWFRICFEKEFKNDEEADKYLTRVFEEIEDFPMDDLHGEFEERAK